VDEETEIPKPSRNRVGPASYLHLDATRVGGKALVPHPMQECWVEKRTWTVTFW